MIPCFPEKLKRPVCLTLTMVLLAVKQRELPTQKKMSLFATVFFIVVILGLQIAFPQMHISSIAVVMIVLAIYLNMAAGYIH